VSKSIHKEEMAEMSDKPTKILAFIQDFIRDRGYAPTIGEIQKTCDICSKSVVDYHLEALERAQLIRRDSGVTRGIHLTSQESRRWSVPLLGTIAAGEPIPVPGQENWRNEMVEVPWDFVQGKEGIYALKVKGTSMIDALVDDGDIVVLRAVNTADDGDMVAAWLTDRERATLKRLYHESGRIRLQPANRTMEPIYVDPAQIQIQGRVIAVLRKVE
jgi:repressor LexA